MHVITLALGCWCYASHSRRVRIESEKTDSGGQKQNTSQVDQSVAANSDDFADMQQPQAFAAFLQGSANPAAGWQGVARIEPHAMSKPKHGVGRSHVGTLPRHKPHVRMSPEQVTDESTASAGPRFNYRVRSGGGGYRADGGRRPQRRNTDDRDGDSPARASSTGGYRAAGRQRPRRDHADNGWRPRDRDSEDSDFSQHSDRPRRGDLDGGWRGRESGSEDSDFGLEDTDSDSDWPDRSRQGGRVRANGGYRPRPAGAGASRGVDGDRRRAPGMRTGRGTGTWQRSDSFSDDDDFEDDLLAESENVYGVSPVLAAMKAKTRDFHKLWLSSNFNLNQRKENDAALREIVRLAKQMDVEIEECHKGHLNNLCNHRPHQGVVLEATPIERKQLSLLPEVKEGEAPVWLALDEVTDPMHFGALLRTALFLGVDGVVMSKKNCAPLTPVVSKTSSGAMEIMRIHEVKNLVATLETAKEDGWQVVGTALDSSAIAPSELNRTAPTVLVLGNEGHGLRPMVKRQCTTMVRIPRGSSSAAYQWVEQDVVDSLNVGVAGGVLLHSLLADRAGNTAKEA